MKGGGLGGHFNASHAELGNGSECATDVLSDRQKSLSRLAMRPLDLLAIQAYCERHI